MSDTVDITDIQMRQMVRDGLLEKRGDRFYLTKKGEAEAAIRRNNLRAARLCHRPGCRILIGGSECSCPD